MEQHPTQAYIDELIVRFLSEGLEAGEQAVLQEWIAAGTANRDHFIAMRDTWLLSAPASAGRYNADEAWEALAPGLATPIPGKPQYSRWRGFRRMAALWLLPFALGGGAVYLWLSLQGPVGNLAAKWITVTSPKGATTHIRLSDGTEVWLNAGSELQYSQAYDEKKRIVKLQGEAFFQVHTNAARPFRVQTADLEIMALGTAFNVKAYPEDGKVVTTLVEGRVKINSQHTSKPFSIELKPNQHVTYHIPPPAAAPQQPPAAAPQKKATPEEAPVERNEVANTAIYTGWKDGSWIIASESLEELAVVMERRFNVRVVFADEQLKLYKFSGTFRQETLEQILNILKLTAPLKYKIDNGVVTLELDKERKEKFSKALPAGH